MPNPALVDAAVGRFGMSDAIGFVAVPPQDGEASALQGLTEVSEHTRQRVDAEVKRIVGEAHEEAIGLLTEHRDRGRLGWSALPPLARSGPLPRRPPAGRASPPA